MQYKNLIKTLLVNKDGIPSGRNVFTVKETEMLNEIAFLEGKLQDDRLDPEEYEQNKKKLNNKVKEFKSLFVLSEDDWIK